MYDLIIRNGTVIDGRKTPRFRADVGVQGDRIAAIGDLSRATSPRFVDAGGLIVAPGFVDVHNHSDGWLLKTNHFVPKTTQGFTTEVLMLDGISYAPVNPHTARQWLFYLRALDGLQLDDYRGWESIEQFTGQLHGRNVQNFMVHIPYANLRSIACGFQKQTVDDFQMRQIKLDVERGMDEGAVGLSTGLDYIVQCYATTDELVDVCKAMADRAGLYVTHVRYKIGTLNGIKEAVEIGRRAGVPVHISHIKGQSSADVEEILEYVDNVARHETDFSFDVYPYQPGSTMLSYLLPYDVWEDGPLAAMARLQEPHIRRKLRDGFDAYRLNLDRIRIAWVAGKQNAQLQGRRLSEYVDASGLPIEEAVCNLLIEERLAVLLVFDEGDDQLIQPFLQHDLYMMGTDGIYCEDGPIHPRVYGSAPRLLGPLVRDARLFSLEDAVYKLSGWPADRFGLKNRGCLHVGHFADIVVFDPDSIADRATYDDPHQPSVGVREVLVNGVSIIAAGAPLTDFNEPLPGRYLRFHSED